MYPCNRSETEDDIVASIDALHTLSTLFSNSFQASLEAEQASFHLLSTASTLRVSGAPLSRWRLAQTRPPERISAGLLQPEGREMKDKSGPECFSDVLLQINDLKAFRC